MAAIFQYSGNFSRGCQEPTEKVQIAACWISPCGSSTPPTARIRPSGEKLTLTTSAGKSSEWIKVPLRQSHIFAVASLETDASICPSGEKANPQTMPLCPSSLRIDCPLATSHNRTAKSSVLPPAEARMPLSGMKAKLRVNSPSPKLVKISSRESVSGLIEMSVGVGRKIIEVGATGVNVGGPDNCVAV